MLAFVPMLWLGALLLHTWHGPDIWYHLSWGRDIWQTGGLLPVNRPLLEQPVPANPYWLFQTVVYGLYSLTGVAGITALFGALWAAIAATWIRVAGLWRAPHWGWLGVLIFILGVQTRFEARPEVVSYLLLLVQLHLVGQAMQSEVWRPRVVLMALVAQAIWANAHVYFVLGPMVGIAALMAHGRDARLRHRLAALVAAQVFGSLLTPFGANLWFTIWGYAQVGAAVSPWIHELNPTPFALDHPPTLAFWISAAILTVLTVIQTLKRGRAWALILLCMGLLLAIKAQRNVPLFFLLMAPALHPFAVRWGRPRLKGAAFLAFGVTFFLTGLTASGAWHRWFSPANTFGVGLEPAAYPIAATAFLQRHDSIRRVFCDSYDGGYLAFHLPRVRVVGDSYFGDPRPTLRYFEAIRSPEALAAFDRAFQFDALVINIENVEVISALWTGTDWKAAHLDSHRIVFVRAANRLIPEADVGRSRLYDGTDSRRWPYTFGILNWSGLAFKFQRPDLMNRLLTDARAAMVIPAPALNFAMRLARARDDAQLLKLARELLPRAIGVEPGDLEALKRTVDSL